MAETLMSVEAEVRKLRDEVEWLRRELKELRRRAVFFDHWHNTMRSTWWMRLWWWCQGYRLLSLGTWYRAPWNESARKYD